MEEKIEMTEEVVATETEAVSEQTAVEEQDIEKKFDWKEFWDKVTTGLLIFLICSPFLILLYIFLWFIFR